MHLEPVILRQDAVIRDLPLHTSLHAKLLTLQCQKNFIHHCWFKDVKLACTRSRCAKPLILCVLIRPMFTKVLARKLVIPEGYSLCSRINSVSSPPTSLTDKKNKHICQVKVHLLISGAPFFYVQVHKEVWIQYLSYKHGETGNAMYSNFGAISLTPIRRKREEFCY